MKKAIACLLVLPLTLAACGAQTTQPAPTTAPEMTTEATTENGKSTPAEVNQPGITGRMRPCSTEVETAAGLYTLQSFSTKLQMRMSTVSSKRTSRQPRRKRWQASRWMAATTVWPSGMMR